MKIHYFQRYHEKENVATANTMLLLSRLYSYSSDKFFRLLKSEYFSDSFEPEIVFTLQEKSIDSIPDATITQEGFKIVVEAKMSDWFYSDQLMRHLNSFVDEKNKVLITIAPEFMENEKRADFEKMLSEYNNKQTHPVVHINTTFEQLANAVQDVLDDRDYEMQDVLDDYLSYCQSDGLITVSDSWKYMRMPLAGKTFEFCVENSLYYCSTGRNFRPHDYIGLYTGKSIRAIGKIKTIVVAKETNGETTYNVECGELTDDIKAKIDIAIANKHTYGWDDECRYFIVEKFYHTDFKKVTPRAPMGARIFDLSQILGTNELPNTEVLAEILKEKTWS